MRIALPLRQAYKVINHGPTTLISTAAGDRRNVMAAAWVMPLDFEPPKVAAVIEAGSFTRELVDQTGEFVVNVPTVAQVDQVYAVGKVSGRQVEKFTVYGLAFAAASKVASPLVEGCVAWLECRVVPERAIEDRYDLFVAEVVAVWADDRVWQEGSWSFQARESRSLHHLSKGRFLAIGDPVEAQG